MNCHFNDCDARATCAVGIKIPAMNCPIPEHEPIRIVCGLVVCDEHLKETKPSDLLDESDDCVLKQLVRKQCKDAGAAEPDFERAFITRVEFTDQDYIALQVRRQQGNN